MPRKTALITGASSGIGRALAHQFALNGYNIVAVARTEEDLVTLTNELSVIEGTVAHWIAKDLAEDDAAQEIYDELLARSILIDVLVNDAGIGQRELFHETDIEKDLIIIQLNIVALTRMTKIFLRDMIIRNDGKILNVGSVASFQPGPLLAVYHASKAYVLSFSEAIAEEIKDSAVSITVLCPGATDTDFFRKADMQDTQVYQHGQLMEPGEVAKVGYEACMKGERVVIPGFTNKVMTFTRRLIPIGLQAKINKKFYEVSEES